MAFFKKAKDREQLVLSYIRTFKSEDGEAVLDSLVKQFQVFDSIIDSDPIEMAYKAGQRDVILRILRTINTDPIKLAERIIGQSEEERND